MTLVEPFTVSVLLAATLTLSEKLADVAVSGLVIVVAVTVFVNDGRAAVVDTVADGTVRVVLTDADPVTARPCCAVNSPPAEMPLPVVVAIVLLNVDAPVKLLVPLLVKLPASVRLESKVTAPLARTVPPKTDATVSATVSGPFSVAVVPIPVIKLLPATIEVLFSVV